MKKTWLFIAACCASIGIANAAGRLEQNPSRTTTASKTTLVREQNTGTTTTARHGTTVSRTVGASRNNTRAATPTRSATTSTARTGATILRGTSQARAARTATNGITKNIVSTSRNAKTPITARTATTATDTDTFGTGYNTCRDAYFTCMDQFCAKQNESYRRCICSSRLTEIQSRERALGVAADSLIDFKNLNIDVIPKTAAEVKAMLSATEGEAIATQKKDTSAAANQLEGISAVLQKSKKAALSTQGQLDIAGDINAIWSTTDLAGGANIANLTGEALYNAVHAQCAEIMSSYCPTYSTQRMVISAYGMYIENDCSALISNLDKKLLSANATIRETEREMQTARLENYNAHNASSINDCIASVRNDITADTACGAEFVHCLDVSGRYLNYDTGAPIYTPDFYQLESQISLSGDVLNNQTNRMVVAALKSKRKYAENSLKTCTDLADDVWDEFMRQAIREIYQGQQERVRQVKDECLSVVNKCYDEQSKSLKDFSNIKEQLLLGQNLELSEEMCRDKLTACSNLYGNMDLLVTAMHNITNQKIGKECRTTLLEYAADLCAVPSNDTLHAYPFGCRTYTPGEQRYATNDKCNDSTSTECDDYIGSLYHKMVRYALNACVRPSESNPMILPTTVLEDVNVVMDQIHVDMARVLATECARLGGIWVSTEWKDETTQPKNDDDQEGNNGQNDTPSTQNDDAEQTSDKPDGVHDITGDTKYTLFYDETGANDKWGFCAKPNSSGSNTGTGGDGTGDGDDNSGNGNGGGSGGGSGGGGPSGPACEPYRGSGKWPTSDAECNAWVAGSKYTSTLPENYPDAENENWTSWLVRFESGDNYVAPHCKCPDNYVTVAYHTSTPNATCEYVAINCVANPGTGYYYSATNLKKNGCDDTKTETIYYKGGFAYKWQITTCE